MTASQARALQRDVLLEPWDASSEEACRVELVQVFQRLAERVTWLWDDVLVLEIGATSHLHGGESAMLDQVADLADSCGHIHVAVVAEHPVGSAVLSTTPAPPRIVPTGALATALAPLPLETLRLTSIADDLRSVGVRTLGAFAELPASAVARRWGAMGATAHRLVRGASRSRHAVWVAPSDDSVLSHHLVLGEPTSQLQPLLFALSGVLRAFAKVLSARDEAAVALRLRLVLDWGVFLAPVDVRFGRPTRNLEGMMRVVASCLEQVKLRAPLTEVMVELTERAPCVGWQGDLSSRRRPVEPLPDLLARLCNALGEEAVFRAKLSDTWEPERAWCPQAMEHTLLSAVCRASCSSSSRPLSAMGRSEASVRDDTDDPVSALHEWEVGRLVQVVAPPRPSVLLEHPVPIAVALVEQVPVRVQLDSAWRTVTRASGPEHLSGEWWRRDGGFDREYWVLNLGGVVAWVFIERGRWALHGWFD